MPDLETTTIVRMPAEVVEFLSQTESMELISLDPDVREPNSKTAFHKYEVLGRMHVKDASSRSLIADEVVKGTESTYTINADGTQNMAVTACGFSPRHGIRATRGGETVDLLICYKCGDMLILKNDENVASIQITTRLPVTMNKMLSDAGIKMDDPSKN